jgi:hypothetical protein
VKTTSPFSRHRDFDPSEDARSRPCAGDEAERVLFAELGGHFRRHLGNLLGRPRKIRDSARVSAQPLERFRIDSQPLHGDSRSRQSLGSHARSDDSGFGAKLSPPSLMTISASFAVSGSELPQPAATPS